MTTSLIIHGREFTVEANRETESLPPVLAEMVQEYGFTKTALAIKSLHDADHINTARAVSWLTYLRHAYQSSTGKYADHLPCWYFTTHFLNWGC